MLHTPYSTERYPAGFSDNLYELIREAITFGAAPDLTLDELNAQLAPLSPFQREKHLRMIWDRL